MIPSKPAMPGECHPAYADRAEIIRTSSPSDGVVLLPEYADEGLDYGTSAIVETRYRVLERRRVVGSLDPRFGWWVWTVWVDDVGRQVADVPERTRWVDRVGPLVWNPGREWRYDTDGRPYPAEAWRATGDTFTRTTEVCEICAGTGTDYLGRPCRVHGKDDA